MEIKNIFIIVAATGYNCDAYGANAYSECSTTSTSTSSGTTASASGGLADTGWNILLPLLLGAAIIIASLILLAKRLVREYQQKRA